MHVGGGSSHLRRPGRADGYGVSVVSFIGCPRGHWEVSAPERTPPGADHLCCSACRAASVPSPSPSPREPRGPFPWAQLPLSCLSLVLMSDPPHFPKVPNPVCPIVLHWIGA